MFAVILFMLRTTLGCFSLRLVLHSTWHPYGTYRPVAPEPKTFLSLEWLGQYNINSVAAKESHNSKHFCYKRTTFRHENNDTNSERQCLTRKHSGKLLLPTVTFNSVWKDSNVELLFLAWIEQGTSSVLLFGSHSCSFALLESVQLSARP